jgi:hypothetical protein
MEDSFEERKNSEEAKYKLDAEKRFKAEARRNKLLGLWAAERMGMSQSEAEAYAGEVVRVDLTEPGIEDVVRKVAADAESRNVNLAADEIREQLERLYTVALEQIDADYPGPLGPDHGKVGD